MKEMNVFNLEIPTWNQATPKDISKSCLQRTSGCYQVTHPWPLHINFFQLKLQVDGSQTLYNMSNKTVTQTVRVLSIMFYVLMENRQAEIPPAWCGHCPFSLVLSLGLNIKQAGAEGCNQYTIYPLKKH